ncbi:hypothetical protein F442_19227 [Phytophthora nicotianae P10297]|uniref:Multiple inositol polyphosphate phosphatase 1 n=1 Tax=Phytophthora nicotianae P10297 TaxID=1317064 RepID=W2YAB3_PHYNI|nr:hypothetical protein F442_19227 [Phytophthora nicotianae P10297]
MWNKFVILFILLPSVTTGSNFSLQSFATKTKYWDQRESALPSALQSESVIQRSELELVQLQQVNRHGSRFPSKGNMGEIADLLSKLQTNYLSLIPDWLKNYSLPYTQTNAGELAPVGFAELAGHGSRSRNSVMDSIPVTYNASLFKIAHTSSARTADSAKAFASTFFSNPDDVEYIEYPDGSVCSIHCFASYDECERYNAEVLDNASALTEFGAFQTSVKMNESIAFLKSQLSLPSDADLSATDAASVFSACAFDAMLYNVTSQWCSLVDQAFLNHLEYSDELETFYEQGPGYKINYEISAVLLQNIYAYMKNFTTGDVTTVANLRFAHAETTLPLMTLLGYGDRTKLQASWTDAQIDSRGFRSSSLAPMASNIDFRLYRSKSDQKYYVSVWVQEVEAPLPGCDGAIYCEFSLVEKIWSYYLNDYNFEIECAL